MHRVPLGVAIAILIFQLFLAISSPDLFNETIWITIGVNALFVVISIIRIIIAVDESKKEVNANLNFQKQEVEQILASDVLNDTEKILEIIKLSNEGNLFAALLLKKLKEETEGDD